MSHVGVRTQKNQWIGRRNQCETSLKKLEQDLSSEQYANVDQEYRQAFVQLEVRSFATALWWQAVGDATLIVLENWVDSWGLLLRLHDIDPQTARSARIDLDMYRVSLERALLRFHSAKMKEINEYLAELWHSIYAGKDVETIEIRPTEMPEYSGGRRKYNYSVGRWS